MDYKDYYKVLGVSKSATAKEVKSAFRRLAREYHPDVNKDKPGAEARFKEVNEAYEVLGDAEKRRRYDQLGANWGAYEQWQRAGGQGGTPFDFSRYAGGGPRSGGRTMSEEDLRDLFGGLGGHAAGGGATGGASAGGFSDFFRTFFDFGATGGGPGRARAEGPTARRGSDIEHEVELSLEEAYAGASRILQLTTPDGRSRRLEVKLPAGVSEAKGVRYAGQGNPGVGGGPAGDLVVRPRLKAHERFSRDGDDLTLRLAVPVTTLVLGGEVEVPTIAGPRILTIPAATADGRRIRLKGQGMPRLGRAGERGDLLVEVHAALPANLSPRQRQLFEELARLEEAAKRGAAD